MKKKGSKIVKTIQVWSKTISVGLPKVRMHKEKFGLLFTGQGWNTSWKLGTLWDMGISPRRSQKTGWTLDLSYELYPAFSSKGRIESILGLFTHLRHDLEVKQTLPSGSKFTNHSHYRVSNDGLITTSFAGNFSSNSSKWLGYFHGDSLRLFHSTCNAPYPILITISNICNIPI